MGSHAHLRAVASALAALVFTPAVADAQYFGRNKVAHERTEVEVLKTEHFDIHYAPRDRRAVEHAASMAERWYGRLSRVLDHGFKDRQPLVLYGSHPDFAQTNIVAGFLDESIGGVTESLKRRIVMPFAATLAETDHVLGHEIVHAFQYDISRRHGHGAWLPLWVAEGMAEYLSVGPESALTAMWMRDAASHGMLPSVEDLLGGRVSPYRYGHAFWAYLAGRFGDDVMGRILKAGPSHNIVKRLRQVTEVEIPALSRDWKAATEAAYVQVPGERGPEARPLITRRGSGRMNLGPALSPDGREVIFLSERDRLSIDVFVADAATGAIKRKLIRTATDPQLESLQFVNSTGAWDPSGRRFAFAIVRRGSPVLTIIDVTTRRVERRISLPRLGEIFNPSWSPDGSAIVFSGLDGGVTDLHLYDLATGTLRRLTDDAFADLQPAWSPDGRTIAFATDRYGSDLTNLRFAPLDLALVDVASGEIRPATVRSSSDVKRINPQWSSDGGSLYFISDPGGISNVFRLDLQAAAVSQVTTVPTGVTGLIASSPALSVARSAPALVFSVFRRGRYEIHALTSAEAMAGRPPSPPAYAQAGRLPPFERRDRTVAELLEDPAFGLPAGPMPAAGDYTADLSLDAIGQPYMASGGGPFGTFARGGISIFFGDMLGERKLGAAIQAGTRRSDLALQTRYLNRRSRWSWGLLADITPHVRGRLRTRVGEEGDQRTVSREAEQLLQFETRLGAFIAYPFSRTRRIEFGVSGRHLSFARQIRSKTYAAGSRRVLAEEEYDVPAGGAIALGDVSVAIVEDSAVFGPASPILGTRSRLEISPAVGGLSMTSVLADYRRYLMPVRPFTLAARILHAGRYGPDSEDPRLAPLFAGYRHLVRGYGYGALTGDCGLTTDGCTAADSLIGTRMLVTNLELRFPVLGLRSRDLTYGPLPLEGILFADAGVAWTRIDDPTFFGGNRRPARSIGAGVRVNAMGMIVEVAAVRPFDRDRNKWGLSLNLRPGF